MQASGPVTPPRWLAFARFEKARLQLARTVRVCHEDYYGYLIAFYRGEYLAIARELGPVELDRLTAAGRLRLERRGLLFRSSVLEGVQAAVTARQLERARRTPRAVAVRLMRTCTRHLRRITHSA
jgi:hypothetical protein